MFRTASSSSSSAAGSKFIRSEIFKRFPRTGIPGRFDSYLQFKSYVDLLVKTGCIDNAKKIWWDVRAHPFFDTVEIRICDMTTRPNETLGMAALNTSGRFAVASFAPALLNVALVLACWLAVPVLEALALPTEEAATLALRTQQIVAHESGIADFVDALGGSYAIEALTERLEREAASVPIDARWSFDTVVVDEGQDFKPCHWQLVRALAAEARAQRERLSAHLGAYLPAPVAQRLMASDPSEAGMG